MKSFAYYLNRFGEIGVVQEAANWVVQVVGLPNVRPNEKVLFENGGIGQALFLSPDLVEVLIFGDQTPRVGTKVCRTGENLTISVSDSLLGQLIDPFCRRLDGLTNQFNSSACQRTLDVPPAGIENRTAVKRPLNTGVKIVDLLIPLGMGQRELVIGDRKTGKTQILLQTAVSQAKKGLICIYAAIGKRQLEIKAIEEFFRLQGVSRQVVLVATGAQSPAGLIYLTPWSAMALAEYFMEKGKDVLVIFDDLTFHAKICREIALLSRRFPGRDSYPVDIFYTHARLLERAGSFKDGKKETSISALVAVETPAGDLGGYIQTNLMSITDGHIYFDSDLFAKGQRPSINPFLSVTRVGRQAQTPLLRQLGRELIAFLTVYEKRQSFVHFGAELTESIKKDLKKGEMILEFFNQKPDEIWPINLQILILGRLWLGLEAEAEELKQKYLTDLNWQKTVDKTIEKIKDLPDLLKVLPRLC